jgi:hypothetical protein
MKTAHLHPVTFNLALTRHSSPTIYRCFALAQLLYRWRHQSGIFWIPPRIFSQYYHMSLMDFMFSPPGCGGSVTDFRGWDAHDAQLRCPHGMDGDTWTWSTRRGVSSTKLPRPWSPWESFPSRTNFHGRAGNRTRDLMITLTTRPRGWSHLVCEIMCDECISCSKTNVYR